MARLGSYEGLPREIHAHASKSACAAMTAAMLVPRRRVRERGSSINVNEGRGIGMETAEPLAVCDPVDRTGDRNHFGQVKAFIRRRGLTAMKPGGSSLAIIILTALFLPAPPSARTQPGTAVQAITTSKSGEFHRCYKALGVFDTGCAVHHVDLPEHIAVGDYIKLEYGSNPKHYAFHVSQIIRQQDGGCIIRSDRTGSGKIEVASCQLASQ
jgi:hypothetical protein